MVVDIFVIDKSLNLGYEYGKPLDVIIYLYKFYSSEQ